MVVNLLKADLSDAEKLLEIQKTCFSPHLERYQDFETSPATVSLVQSNGRLRTRIFIKLC